VDVELRREMWALVGGLKAHGVTIILTTHYIDEAEQMADRIGIISKGELIVVDEKASLMQKLGKRTLTLKLEEPMRRIPDELSGFPLVLASDGFALQYAFDANDGSADIPSLLRRVSELRIRFKDLNTGQTSLEEIFVSLVGGKNGGAS
jgi:ABC-2 type transport system ATP-binding protein